MVAAACVDCNEVASDPGASVVHMLAAVPGGTLASVRGTLLLRLGVQVAACEEAVVWVPGVG